MPLNNATLANRGNVGSGGIDLNNNSATYQKINSIASGAYFILPEGATVSAGKMFFFYNTGDYYPIAVKTHAGDGFIDIIPSLVNNYISRMGQAVVIFDGTQWFAW